MMTKDEIIDELERRSKYLIEMDADDPAEYDDNVGPVKNAVATAFTNYTGGATLIGEMGIDDSGQPFILARAIDSAGDPAALVVLDTGMSVMINVS